METVLAAAVKVAVEQWKASNTLEQRCDQLREPSLLGASLGASTELALLAAGAVPGEVRAWALTAPFVHLSGVFDPTESVDTPTSFCPVPDTAATVEGRGAALAVHAMLRLETVSYGTENDGDLFVNLVGLGGKGRMPEKSKRAMRGHTDGVCFPLNGADDGDDQRIAPSPDVVTLVGIRNPQVVPTKVIPLAEVLAQLKPEDILELKKRQFSMNAQMTFIQGMKELWGQSHVANNEAVLSEVDGDTHVRYSHSSVVPTDATAGRAQEASDRFEASCSSVPRDVLVAPGDVLMVSNRLALHGRGEPGAGTGGLSRWLLRAYGLDTSGLDAKKRHMNGRPAHVLYP